MMIKGANVARKSSRRQAGCSRSPIRRQSHAKPAAGLARHDHRFEDVIQNNRNQYDPAKQLEDENGALS
jgi:hypothetical protein